MRALGKNLNRIIRNIYARRIAHGKKNDPFLYDIGKSINISTGDMKRKEPGNMQYCLGNTTALCYDGNMLTLRRVQNNTSEEIALRNLNQCDMQLWIVNNKFFLRPPGKLMNFNCEATGFDMSYIDYEKLGILISFYNPRNPDSIVTVNHFFNISKGKDYLGTTKRFVMLLDKIFVCVIFNKNKITYGEYTKEDDFNIDCDETGSLLDFRNLRTATRVDAHSFLLTDEKTTFYFYEENGCLKYSIIHEGVHAIWKDLIVLYENDCLNLYSFDLRTESDELGTRTCYMDKKFIKTLVIDPFCAGFITNNITLTEFGVHFHFFGKYAYYFFSRPVGHKKLLRD